MLWLGRVWFVKWSNVEAKDKREAFIGLGEKCSWLGKKS